MFLWQLEMKRQARQSGEDGSVALEDDVVDEEEFELLTKVPHFHFDSETHWTQFHFAERLDVKVWVTERLGSPGLEKH